MNNENLKPFNTLTESKQREIAQKGGKMSVKRRAERKALKEELLLLLDSKKTQKKLCIALLDKALNGDTKAFEIIRDTIGENPNKIEVGLNGFNIVVADERAKKALEDL